MEDREGVPSLVDGNGGESSVSLRWKLSGAGLVVLAFLVAYYWHGENTRVLIHDNLDSNIPLFVRLAKSDVLFGPIGSTFEPVMGGIPRGFLCSELYLPILPYRYLPPFWAYLFNELVVRLTAVVGMALLLRHYVLPKHSDLIVFGVAICFSLLPFYLTSGLSIAGQPLLCYAVLRLADGARSIISWLVVGLFPFFSSLVMVGFVFVGLLGIYAVVRSIRTRRIHRRVMVAFVLLTVGYFVADYRLVHQLLFERSYQSHRFEMTTRFRQTWRESLQTAVSYFIRDQIHTQSYQYPVEVWTTAAALVIAACVTPAKGFWAAWFGRCRRLLLVVLAIALISFIYGICQWEITGELLMKFLGGLAQAFNWSRVHWLSTMLWSLAFALALQQIHHLVLAAELRRIRTRWSPAFALALQQMRYLPRMGTIAVATLIGLQLLFMARYHHWRRSDQPLTYHQFFSPELFQEVRRGIARPQSDYRVASLGLHPSIALYNDFNTVDGYVANYPLDHKRKFRAVIARELDKDPKLEKYFDGWGNRCYLFAHDLTRNRRQNGGSKAQPDLTMVLTKDHPIRTVEDLDFDFAALKQLGCDYLLSAVEIKDYRQLNLQPVGKFERSDSPWQISVYALKNTEPGADSPAGASRDSPR